MIVDASISRETAHRMIVDTSRIERALSPLIGLPLCESHRAADMQMFDFGEKRTRVSRFGPRKGQSFEVREYSLHIQCVWRIRGATGIVVGSTDLQYRSGADPLAGIHEWDWQVSGASRRDQRLAAWLERAPYEVARVTADAIGGFTLTLIDGFALDIFPDDSLDGEHSEHWRLLHPGGQFVVSGSGIDG